MTGMTGGLRLVILAAQRRGVIDPLAERFGTSHKCLVPLRGRPLIAHVLSAVAHHPGLSDIVVSIEPEVAGTVRAIADAIGGAPVTPVAARDNLADSVRAAADGHDGPLIITTADHALLKPASIDAMAEALGRGDVAMAMSPEAAVRAAHADGQRRFYQFRDRGYSNCNLYGLAHAGALDAAEIFRGGGQFAKKASRIVSAFGLINLLLLQLRLVSLEGAMARISRRIGLRIVPVVLTDGSQAIDVDNERTHAVAAELLALRGRAVDPAVAAADLAPDLSLAGA